MTQTTIPAVSQWQTICPLTRIIPNTGVCALVNNEQVAIFRIGDEVFAIANYDPFSKAYVLSRGIVKFTRQTKKNKKTKQNKKKNKKKKKSEK